MVQEEKMDYEALKPILYGRDEFKTREYFGTSLPKHYDATVVDSIATRMITKCKVWTSHWETVQEAIAPEVEEIRLKQFEDRISKDPQWKLEALLKVAEAELKKMS